MDKEREALAARIDDLFLNSAAEAAWLPLSKARAAHRQAAAEYATILAALRTPAPDHELREAVRAWINYLDEPGEIDDSEREEVLLGNLRAALSAQTDDALNSENVITQMPCSFEEMVRLAAEAGVLVKIGKLPPQTDDAK